MEITPAAQAIHRKAGFRLMREFSGPAGSGKTRGSTALKKELEAMGYEVEIREIERAGGGVDQVWARKIT